MSLSFQLHKLPVGQDSEADALDVVIRQANLELDELLNTLNHFDLVCMLANTIALNHQLLGIGNEFQANEAFLPERRLNLLDRRVQVAAVGEGVSSELRRHGSIGKRKAERFNVGTDTPLHSRDPEVPKLTPTHSFKRVLRRESFDSVRELATKEGCIADHDYVVFLIVFQE